LITVFLSILDTAIKFNSVIQRSFLLRSSKVEFFRDF